METNRSYQTTENNDDDKSIESNEDDESMESNDDERYNDNESIMSAMSNNSIDYNVLVSVRTNDEKQEQEQSPVIEQRTKEEVNRQFCTLWKTMSEPNWTIQVFIENVTTLLDQYHADINATEGYWKDTLLARICRCEHYQLSYYDQYDAICHLLNHNADPNLGDILSWVLNKYLDGVFSEALFQEMFHCMIANYGANVNHWNEQHNPLMIDALQDLCHHSAIMVSGISNITQWSDRFIYAMKLFLQYKGDINSQSSHTGWTLLSMLSYFTVGLHYDDNQMEILQHVHKIMKFLLESGANIDIGYGYQNGNKTIHNACMTGNLELVQLLLEHHGCHTNNHINPIPLDHILRSEYYGDDDDQQTTAFHVAMKENKVHFIPVAQLLLQYDADINIQDSIGNTILHDLVRSYKNDELNETILRFILDDCHADYLMIRNNDGNTAWDYGRIQKKKHYHSFSKNTTTATTSPPNVVIRIMPYEMMEQKRRQQIMSSIRFFHTTGLLRG
jgi:ankyrin repeat protein